MRTLSFNEINSVSGAGYNEDIITAAASLYVGSTVGRFASTLTTAAFSSIATIAGRNNVGATISTIGNIAAPIMFFAAPLMLAETMYPGLVSKKIEYLLTDNLA